jgi:hypothetical protein
MSTAGRIKAEIPAFFFSLAIGNYQQRARVECGSLQNRSEQKHSKSHQKEQELAGSGDVRDYIGHHG